MSAEWVTAIATVGTLLVIAASALAALIQLRHMRNGNQLAVLNEFYARLGSEHFRKALRFIAIDVPARSNEGSFRRELLSMDSPQYEMVRDVANFLDRTGSMVKHGMVNRDLACDLFYTTAVRTWTNLAPFIASHRALKGVRVWEDWEYLVAVCHDFRRRFPSGTYPRNMAALALPEPWPEVESMLAHEDEGMMANTMLQ